AVARVADPLGFRFGTALRGPRAPSRERAGIPRRVAAGLDGPGLGRLRRPPGGTSVSDVAPPVAGGADRGAARVGSSDGGSGRPFDPEADRRPAGAGQ